MSSDSTGALARLKSAAQKVKQALFAGDTPQAGNDIKGNNHHGRNNNNNSDNNTDKNPHGHYLSPAEHGIAQRDLSKGAVRVLQTLNEAGYQAYLVGGCVRDLLLGLHPKDFDIATDATPEQVVDVFQRGARIIGRRFQIVHVRQGREIIEVTTFRGHHHQGGPTSSAPKADRSQRKNQSSQNRSSQNKHGMLLRDNIYGSIEEDALRRDFTANALYYNLLDETVADFVNGLTAIQQRQLTIIGNPEQRYREDPVRMLRAVRLAAKLDFTLEANTAAAIDPLKHLLKEVPPARLFDECLKLFMHGHAHSTFLLLQQYGLFAELFPHSHQQLNTNNRSYQAFLEQAFKNTDERIRADKRVTPAYLFAAMLWPAFEQSLENFQVQERQRRHKPCPPLQVFYPAADTATEQCLARISIPRRFSTPMKEIWQLQYRLPKRNGAYAQRVFEHKRFRAAYDFVLLRESSGEDLQGLGQWWTDYQNTNEDGRMQLQQQLKRKPNNRANEQHSSEQPGSEKRRRPRRRRGKPRSTPPSGT